MGCDELSKKTQKAKAKRLKLTRKLKAAGLNKIEILIHFLRHRDPWLRFYGASRLVRMMYRKPKPNFE